MIRCEVMLHTKQVRSFDGSDGTALISYYQITNKIKYNLGLNYS